LNVEVRTPDAAVAAGDKSSRGSTDKLAWTASSPYTACASCGRVKSMDTNGKPMKKVVLKAVSHYLL
jgi:hypothetical protein